MVISTKTKNGTETDNDSNTHRIEVKIRIGSESSEDLITAAENKLRQITGIETVSNTSYTDISPRCGGGGTYITIKSTITIRTTVSIETITNRLEEKISVESATNP